MSPSSIAASLAIATILAAPALARGADTPDAKDAKLLLTGEKEKPIDGLVGFDVSPNGRFIVFTTGDWILPGLQPAFRQIYLKDKKTGKTELVSRGHDGQVANDDCYSPVVSDDGRRVAFTTTATNFGVATGVFRQVVLVDLPSGDSSVISVDPFGGVANATCDRVAISGDGEVVAFGTVATNLAPSQPVKYRVYAHDASVGSLECVSVATSGAYADSQASEPSLSFDGRYVAFESNAGNLPTPGSGVLSKIFVRDRKLGSTTLISKSSGGMPPDGWCSNPSISSDGRFVAFASDATNLSADADLPDTEDIFVVDRDADHCLRIAGGFDDDLDEYVTDLAISANGRRVVTRTWFANSVTPGVYSSRLHVFDRKTQGSVTLKLAPDYAADEESMVTDASIAGNGKRIRFGSYSSAIVANPKGARTAFELKIGKIE